MTARVAAVIVINGGSGYTSAPTVGFTGASGQTVAATATATVSGGLVTGVTITNAGSFTINAPTGITFTGGGGSGATAQVQAQKDAVGLFYNIDLTDYFETFDEDPICAVAYRITAPHDRISWGEALPFLDTAPTIYPRVPFQTVKPQSS
jgi:hypothetical protein